MTVLVLSVVMSPVGAMAQKVPTPVATTFNIEEKSPEFLMFGWHLPLGVTGREKVGLMVTCDRTTSALEAIIFFSFLPVGKPVQVAIRKADGQAWWFGHQIIAPARAGFHSPIIPEPEVRHFLQYAFSHGSLISNGHNSFWNRLSPSENKRAREALSDCGNS